MLKWEKIGRSVKRDGSSTTIYEAHGEVRDYRIESRKRPIPHANRSGSWMHTTYILIVGNQEEEYWRLRDAQAVAEGKEAAQ